MKRLTSVGHQLVATSLLVCVSGCGMLDKPTAEIAGVKIQNVSLTEATMLFDVKVGNPYSVPLPLGNLDYAVSSQGQEFVSGKADVQGTVPAKSSKNLGVPVRITFAKLLSAVKGARPGSTIPYKADMGLSVSPPALGALRVPMSKEGELKIPTPEGALDQLKGILR
ncbi:MAG: Late embryogenesis abundant protein [Planctomycetes bacterium ADurb.Bin126]|nr:MAG: Late embryogenesis abundant protein [Planctomycetes bacterium ADurb.Bin126]HOD82287.1 LEA type 2 family protein [Phycisphaerae bacterium]HQL72900.1 LEA type 2 family protein [Phycisphaerae bacterium]